LAIDPTIVELRFKGIDPTWAEVKEELTGAIAKSPKGTFIRGRTGPTILNDPHATRTSLDELAPDHPVMLKTWTGHSAILNSTALKKLGVKDNERDPVGGRYVRSSDGAFTGLVLGFAGFQLGRRQSEM